MPSQSFQDKFALQNCNGNYTYIEIGAHDPVLISNTYSLEVEHQWKGFSIELNEGHRPAWEQCKERQNKIYWNDALTFDYKHAVTDNNLPLTIGYLSCDIEPPENTFNALKRVINQGIQFECITFEHDKYASEVDWEITAIEFLKDHGYHPLVRDVYAGGKKWKVFETWFVRRPTKSLTYQEWLVKNC